MVLRKSASTAGTADKMLSLFDCAAKDQVDIKSGKLIVGLSAELWLSQYSFKTRSLLARSESSSVLPMSARKPLNC